CFPARTDRDAKPPYPCGLFRKSNVAASHGPCGGQVSSRTLVRTRIGNRPFTTLRNRRRVLRAQCPAEDVVRQWPQACADGLRLGMVCPKVLAAQARWLAALRQVEQAA